AGRATTSNRSAPTRPSSARGSSSAWWRPEKPAAATLSGDADPRSRYPWASHYRWASGSDGDEAYPDPGGRRPGPHIHDPGRLLDHRPAPRPADSDAHAGP